MRLLLLLAVAFCTPAYVAGQTFGPADSTLAGSQQREDASTAEAIAAIARQDYSRAAKLLLPLIDNWSSEVSPVAAFHLGLLYEQGAGVPYDPGAACALYLRASTVPGLFGEMALHRWFEAAKILGPDGQGLCAFLSNVGPKHGFTPAKFTLAADHWVSIDISPKTQSFVATISYRGNEKTVELNAPLGLGAIFVPARYTRLEMDNGAPPRHFIEMAAWMRSPESKWVLEWSLTEIAQDDAAHVGGVAQVTTFEGAAPPYDVAVDLRDFVTLRVNESRTAEYVVLKGPDATRGVIPDGIEREELANESARRQAADKKVDWQQRPDVERPPSLTYADAQGCGDLFVHAWSSNRTETIAVRADREFLQLSTAPRTFNLAARPTELDVVADVFGRPQYQWNACTDVLVVDDSNLQRTWRVVGGTITIQLSPTGVRAEHPHQYRATVQIDNAQFQGSHGQLVRSTRPIRLTAVAGPLWDAVP